MSPGPSPRDAEIERLRAEVEEREERLEKALTRIDNMIECRSAEREARDAESVRLRSDRDAARAEVERLKDALVAFGPSHADSGIRATLLLRPHGGAARRGVMDTPTYGFCNKCGWVGPGKIEHGGILHERCSYFATPIRSEVESLRAEVDRWCSLFVLHAGHLIQCPSRRGEGCRCGYATALDEARNSFLDANPAMEAK
jgi:hypothetical protein